MATSKRETSMRWFARLRWSPRANDPVEFGRVVERINQTISRRAQSCARKGAAA